MKGLPLQSRLHPAHKDFEYLMGLADSLRGGTYPSIEITDGFLEGVTLPEDATTILAEPVKTLAEQLYDTFIGRLESLGVSYGAGLSIEDQIYGWAMYESLLEDNREMAGRLEPYLFLPKDWKVCSFPDIVFP